MEQQRSTLEQVLHQLQQQPTDQALALQKQQLKYKTLQGKHEQRDHFCGKGMNANILMKIRTDIISKKIIAPIISILTLFKGIIAFFIGIIFFCLFFEAIDILFPKNPFLLDTYIDFLLTPHGSIYLALLFTFLCLIVILAVAYFERVITIPFIRSILFTTMLLICLSLVHLDTFAIQFAWFMHANVYSAKNAVQIISNDGSEGDFDCDAEKLIAKITSSAKIEYLCLSTSGNHDVIKIIKTNNSKS